MLCSIQRDFLRAAFGARGFSRSRTSAEIFSILKKTLLASNFYFVVTKTTNKHKRPQTITKPPANNYKPPANDNKPPQITNKTITNNQQTTRNDQIDLFRVPVIYFLCKLETMRSFTDVNEHRYLTSLCNVIYISFCNS